MPVEAQERAPRSADRDEQIEVLKQAIRILQEQKSDQPAGTKLKDSKNEEEIKKLRLVAEKLAKQIKDKGQELHDLQEKHRGVSRKLAELGAAGAWNVEWATPNNAFWYSHVPAPAVATVTPAPAATPFRVHPAEPATSAAYPKGAVIAAPAAAPVPAPVRTWGYAVTTPAANGRPDDWEQRLDRLTNEIQELRTELQREKTRTRSTAPAKK
jgi:hypothetical protein